MDLLLIVIVLFLLFGGGGYFGRLAATGEAIFAVRDEVDPIES